MEVERTHPAETGDSAVVVCSGCNGTKVHPWYHTACEICAGTGWLLQQRFDANGHPIRVTVVEPTKGKR